MCEIEWRLERPHHGRITAPSARGAGLGNAPGGSHAAPRRSTDLSGYLRPELTESLLRQPSEARWEPHFSPSPPPRIRTTFQAGVQLRISSHRFSSRATRTPGSHGGAVTRGSVVARRLQKARGSPGRLGR